MSAAWCSVHDCGGATKARGLCNAHYLRLRKYGDPLGVSKREPLNPLAKARREGCALPRCCSQLTILVTVAESELRRLARLAARRPTGDRVDTALAAREVARQQRTTLNDHMTSCTATTAGGAS